MGHTFIIIIVWFESTLLEYSKIAKTTLIDTSYA